MYLSSKQRREKRKGYIGVTKRERDREREIFSNEEIIDSSIQPRRVEPLIRYTGNFNANSINFPPVSSWR